MKKIILIVLGTILTIIVIIALAGMYKFNYLANQPGYDVDGNKIEVNDVEAYCTSFKEKICPEDLCVICGTTMVSSYASCHSKEFCKIIPLE